MVVVLNDKDEIKSYDISISLEIPQISMNLKDFIQFNDSDHALSIAFGSSCNLSGSLTLYVSTFNAKVHAIYPFIHNNAKIATSKERIYEAIEETTFLLKTIEEKFPSKSIVESLDSTLKTSAIVQFEYYAFLKRQISGSVPMRTEVRGIHTKSPYELVVLDQDLPSKFIPQLQGPLFSGVAPIDELIPLAANDHVSILSSASLTPSNNVILTYYGQLKPLLMKCKNTREEKNPLKMPLQINESKSKGYIKPKRGFGFVDLEDSLDESKKAKTAEQLQNEQNEKELRFRDDELSKLSVLAIDQLPVLSNEKELRMKVLDSNSAKIAIINGSITVGDASQWINTLIQNIVLGNQTPLEVNTQYVTSSSRKESILGLMSVHDTVTATGEYLVVFRRDLKDNLEVISLLPAEEEQTKKLIENQHNAAKQLDPPVLSQEPIDELLRDASELKRTTIQLGAGLSSDHLKKLNGVQSLVDVNKLSTTTIDYVLKYTRYTININARVASEIEVLKSQIETMKKVLDRKLNETKLDENEIQLQTLSKKQVLLDQRVRALKTKLFNSIQKLKANRTLPVSTAEKAWFREINSINNQVNIDAKERKSLVNIVSSLQAQVKEVTERHNADKKELNASTKLRNMELRQQLAKVKYWLEQEDSRISSTKSELEENFKRLAIV